MTKLTSSLFYSLYADNLKGNFVFSPASYLEAINALALCLKGESLAELLAALEVKEEDLVQYVRSYRENLGLETYNAIFYSEEYGPALNVELARLFVELGTDLEAWNDVPTIVERINTLVSVKTRGKINDLLKPDDFNAFTKFVLLNCVYFKREWAHKFKPQSFEQSFFGVDKEVKLKFLHECNTYHYHEDSKMDIVEIPYQDSWVACYIVLPKTNLFELCNDVTSTYQKIGNVECGSDVSLSIPPFTVESDIDLIPRSRLAGINKAFEDNKEWALVDFDKLRPEAAGKISKFAQRATIDFSKDGTEAAAATFAIRSFTGCIGPVELPKPKTIVVDKPFLYVLADRRNKSLPLFIGVVNQL